MQTLERRRAYYRERRADPVFCAKAREYTKQWKRRASGADVNSTTRPQPINCEVCGNEASGREMHWDHDHTTGKFRGWLCGCCNRALGQVKDRPEVLRKLADYLERSF